jgi:APA family basic amino acid/polyamine antiporter
MEAVPRKTLSLFDSVCIIVGIIIGAGIYETAPITAKAAGSGASTILIWLVGGLLALSGGLCYAELATMYPKQGGDYVYLTRAYGKGAGFLFAWTQLAVIRPADIALMAFVFGRYAGAIYPFAGGIAGYAAIAVIVLSVINIIGVRQAKWTQNLLTVIKTVSLLTIAAIGFFAVRPAAAQQNITPADVDIPLALIFVMFTFGGWNETAYVAAEMKKPHQNIARALLIGIAVVTLLYLLINAAFLYALGYLGLADSQAAAVDTTAKVFGDFAGRFIGVIVCISALGAVNGLIFTGARISYALGSEHQVFRLLGKWDDRVGTPVWSLIIQAVIAMAIIIFAGSFINTIFYTAPLVWMFFLASGASVWVLRRKEAQTERKFKTPLFPLPVLIFCATSTMMLYSSASYALANKRQGFIVSIICLAAGAAVYLITSKKYPADKAAG